MKLLQVKKNNHLHWPGWLTEQASIYRGGAGYVVDADAPLEGQFLEGQMHKLEPAADGAKAGPLNDARARRMVSEVVKTGKATDAPKANVAPMPEVVPALAHTKGKKR